MSRLYAEPHRKLQDQFDSRKLADRVEQIIVHDEFTDEDRAFIESRDMFFLSTVDPQGRPTVSYKGGAPGFIRIVDKKTLAFPSYNGNGMFLSMGNIASNNKVGILFIDFEHPHRMRLQGTASVSASDPLLNTFPGAELVVRITVTELFVNCPRYVHQFQRVAHSKYVPDAAGQAPLPAWKRIDAVQDALPARDAGKAEQAGGLITPEQYAAKVMAGEA